MGPPGKAQHPEPMTLPDEPIDARNAAGRWWAGVMRAAFLAVRCESANVTRDTLIERLTRAIGMNNDLPDDRAQAFARIAWAQARAEYRGEPIELSKSEVADLLAIGLGEPKAPSQFTRIHLN